MYLYIDIETIPGGEKPMVDSLKVPGTYKKPESILAWRNDPERLIEVEEIYRKTALDPWVGQICCLAYKLVDEDFETSTFVIPPMPPAPQEYASLLEFNHEHTILQLFQTLLQELDSKQRDKMSVVRFVGHNIRSFDIPYLYLRAAKYGLKWLQQVLPTRKEYDRIEDTMEMCAVTARMTPDKYVSLDKALRFFGFDGKDDISGKDVFELYQQGKHLEIAEYCKGDVERVVNLHNILK